MEFNRLLEKAKENKVENIFSFCGSVDHSQLPVFYRATDIFVIPSYYEPFGLVALEGMANKIPVVSSRVGGLMTITRDGETGLLFEPRNSLDLKQKILSLFKSKDTVKSLTENAYKDVSENYPWHQIVKRINEIYNNLITK